MKRKQIIIGGVIALGLGLGLYALIRSRGADYTSAEELTPTVVSVQVGTLRRMTLRHYVTGYGTVGPAPATAAQPAAGAELAAPGAGVVAGVNVIEGQHVDKGDVLMELNSGTATFAYARAEANRQKKLFARQNTSLKSLQDAEAQLAALEIVAPVSGTVTRLNVKPGEAVDVNMPVAEVVDLSRLAVNTEIPAAETTDLKTGAEVQVQSEKPVTAMLSFVSPAVNSKNGTIRMWILLPADSGLRPGQFVPFRIVTAVRTNCLAAPEESVATDVAGHSVIALVRGDAAVQTPVQTGFRENGWVEVEGTGLKAGDAVVTVGAYGLPEKTRIQVTHPPEGETSETDPSSSPAR